ncbi:SRPBCC family protein [Halpernia frigidisoli]|uniref:Polyketide cyclase / dehydrase and lipid transport n=1 Tax=Halpernia frigidisoli TaxID=1125876 RepID=A0A1I3FQZ0_9FLAO|nr:SRPBCC family protein [Halpernia frigidisoli]SFI13594.1 Polyketide cyclase / dehydrase and lipid transport [Halpernia frigidisoli]
MKTILKIFLALIVIIVIAMFAIGEKYHFEKSIVINAPAEKVYGQVNSSKKINLWNPWMKMDPNLKLQYSGNPGEVGDKYCWKGNDQVGEGCQEITALAPNQKQSTKMTFLKPFESIATSDILLSPNGNQTKVTWTMDCELEYPKNLMKIFLNGQMDKSYGEGLAKLKEISEK